MTQMNCADTLDLSSSPERRATQPVSVEVVVVVVHHNTPHLLASCLESIERQTVRPARVIVVDNGSQQDPRAIVERFRATLVRLDHKHGFAAANNHAMKMLGNAAWMATVNPDARLATTWLESMLRTASASPGYAAFASKLFRSSHPPVLDGCGDVYHCSGLAWRRRHGKSPQPNDDVERDVFSACAAAALYSAAALREIGGFDELFFCYFEDVDVGFRLRLAGFRCKYNPQAVAYHENGEWSHTRNAFAIYHGHRNLVWSFWRNMPTPLLLAFLPLHLLLNLVMVAVFIKRGQGRAILRAKVDSLAGLPRVLRLRRVTQARRRITCLELARYITCSLSRK